jgi:3-phenylpropionate/trans-cinnamate dioxygenase ferredoxin subunit
MYNYLRLDETKCEYVPIGSEDDVKDGKRLFVQIDDLNLVVFNIEGQLYAIADECSHDNGPLGDGELDGLEVICPRHGARFDVRTGRALSLPAVIDIPAYPVRITAGQIEVGIPGNL